ncbi:MAG: NAD(P)-binding domain-containing protein, partial [Rubrivivax sp.]|nr:NAD(P)-binding domain-containing protein [Rubrivivax sp.]
MDEPPIAFVGGGNMAGAIVGGLIGAGRPPASIVVVEPSPE